MKYYKAEVFDYVQYLFQVTGFNDHQLHCLITFQDNIEAAIMKKAVKLLLKTVPILSRVYKIKDGYSCWEDTQSFEWKDLFTTVYNKEEFERFTFSKIKEETGPQVKVCLYRSNKDAISIIMNHMVTDGGGLKQCIYLLSDIYSNLIKNPDYMPDYVIDGDRSYQNIIKKVHTTGKIKTLLLHSTDNNQSGDFLFPMSKDEIVSPFILTHKIMPERYCAIQDFCKKNKVTINDVLLTAYFRILAGMLKTNGKALTIPIMVDMRRYLDDKSLYALTNLTSLVGINTTVDPKEDFHKTLAKVNAEMAKKKQDNFGMNTFFKLHLFFKLFKENKAFHILEKTLHNPNICMTNIGVIDSSKLHFEDASIDNVTICGSIKYRPHFQLAVSTYFNKMTFSVNLYGSQTDRNNILQFFQLMDQELNLLS